ncbi:interferon alpha/beta receptor 2 isoform X2 [Microcaecilia unicolor]|uniref:Interferon alpha/beta receptor 2-like isoform X2 n=1 Tax=Microcaecilia unicolor TaxID=1415580 RepID=A0A6P7XJ46_9AMPH|nr:interferon alpha/beta receptor 2-like isoform X2 [Microcaecilia unicolor]
MRIYFRAHMASVSGLLNLCLLCVLESTALASNNHIELISENFRHILTWEAGNQSTNPTHYRVQYVDFRKRKKWNYSKECFNTTHLSCDLTDEFTDPRGQYSAKAEALMENGTSVWVNYVKLFTPIHQTILGPPTVHITGYDGYLITIQPPVCHLKSPDKQRFLSLVPDVYPELIYKVTLIKAGVTNESSRILEYLTNEGNFTTSIPDLFPMTNYCISVNATATINKNPHAIPSSWKCAVTGPMSELDYPVPAVICGCVLTFGLVLMLVLAMLKWIPVSNYSSRSYDNRIYYTEPVLLYPPEPKTFSKKQNGVQYQLNHLENNTKR